jgi:hypothetical protein
MEHNIYWRNVIDFYSVEIMISLYPDAVSQILVKSSRPTYCF